MSSDGMLNEPARSRTSVLVTLSCHLIGSRRQRQRSWNPLRWLTTVIRRKNIKILKSVKLKQNDVSCEVLVTAIDVKCNFT